MAIVAYAFRWDWQDGWSRWVEEGLLHEAIFIRLGKQPGPWRTRKRGDDRWSAWLNQRAKIADRVQARMIRADLGDAMFIECKDRPTLIVKKLNAAPPADVPPPVTKPVRTLIAALRNAFPNHGNYGYYNCRYIDGTTTPSQHAWGNAYDAGGDLTDVVEMGDWLVEQGKRYWAEKARNPNDRPIYGLPVGKVIYNRRVWTPAQGFQPYTGSDPHTGHLHVEGPVEKEGTPPCMS